MRLPIIGALIGAVLGAAIAVDGWLPGDPSLKLSWIQPLATLAMTVVAVSAVRMFFVMGRRWFSTAGMLSLLRVLPVWSQILLGVLFVLVLTGFASVILDPRPTGHPDPEETVRFFRMFGGIVAWIGAAYAGMAWGFQRMRAAQARAAAGPVEPA